MDFIARVSRPVAAGEHEPARGRGSIFLPPARLDRRLQLALVLLALDLLWRLRLEGQSFVGGSGGNSPRRCATSRSTRTRPFGDRPSSICFILAFRACSSGDGFAFVEGVDDFFGGNGIVGSLLQQPPSSATAGSAAVVA
jgi:hypothetical protein